jgi:hypothetical protein
MLANFGTEVLNRFRNSQKEKGRRVLNGKQESIEKSKEKLKKKVNKILDKKASNPLIINKLKKVSF